MLEIKNLTYSRGDKQLFNNATLTIRPLMRVGLVGENGAGKSSLFSLIQGHLSADAGEVTLPASWRIATVAQETPALDVSALDYVLQGDKKLQQLQVALEVARRQKAGLEEAHLHDQLLEIDAYTAPSRAAKLLSGLGFSEASQHQAVKVFSGGWRMRLNLAQALMSRADLLLLDEPTNHLDLEAVLWLEGYLQSLSCTQVIVSHDVSFLNALTSYTVALSHQKLVLYGGNYDFYRKEEAQRLAQAEAAYVKQQRHIAHVESFIRRFKAKASKATQAQSRMKALERLERLGPVSTQQTFAFSFEAPPNLPNPLLKLDDVTLAYGDKIILQNIDLSIESGARYGLLGVNGSGKSTLIKALAVSLKTGDLRMVSGEVVRANQLQVAYFAQHQLDVLNEHESALSHVKQLEPETKELDLRQFLAQFHFKDKMALEPIKHLSGGEKARLALALMVRQKPNLLLLDEPTNHLDVAMREALMLALQSFSGALILVSHDRNLLEAACDSFLLIDGRKLEHFSGSIDDYRRYRLQKTLLAKEVSESTTAGKQKKARRQEEAKRREWLAAKKAPLVKKITAAEREMATLTVEKDTLEAFLADETSYHEANKTLLQQQLIALATCRERLQTLEEDWLLWQEELEEFLRGKHE